jgi:hypothetical protein
MSEELRRRVQEIYAEVDREVAAAGPVCVASGRCCRFKEYGHVLFLSGLEADVLLADAPPFAGPVTPDFCPFQQDNLCTARGPRPLGCRVYYCDPNYQETGNRITEKNLHRLKELAREHGVDWQYAPLHYFLNQALAGRPAPPAGSHDARVALPMADDDPM